MDNSVGGKSCTTIIRWDLTLYKQPWLEEIICKVSRTVLGEVQERPTEFWKTGGNTTQQHHRIIEWQIGRDLWRSSLPTFCSKQCLLQSKARFLQVLSNRASIISRDAEFRGFLVPVFNDPHYEKKKKLSFIPCWNFHCCSLYPPALFHSAPPKRVPATTE